MFGVWTPSSAQNANLLKNPGADEGSEHWRAFKDAKVEECSSGGRCFVLRSGGYFIQEVVIPKDAVGQYALLIGRAYGERTNRNSPIAIPSLYGYMMNSGDPSGGRIYAYLSGQQMTGAADSSDWTQLWGVFKIKPGTGRISFFLRKGDADAGAVTRFDDLGLYIFPTETQAHALVGQGSVGTHSTTATAAGSDCLLAREEIRSFYGIKLGMSLDEVISLFPASVGDASVERALELSRTGNGANLIRMVIPAHKANKQDLADVKMFGFQFRNGRLFSLHVEYFSPKWKDVNEFIDQRGHMLNLPAASSWEPVEGNSRFSKYLTCDGIEVRFYASPLRSPNDNYISLTDTSVEATAVSHTKPERARQP